MTQKMGGYFLCVLSVILMYPLLQNSTAAADIKMLLDLKCRLVGRVIYDRLHPPNSLAFSHSGMLGILGDGVDVDDVRRFCDSDIVGSIPYLNRYAMYLTRNKADADDLVQWTILRAIEELRKKELYIAKPKPFLAKNMYYIWIEKFVRKKGILKNNCEYHDNMTATNPEVMLVGLFAKCEKLIKRHKLHNQKMLFEFLKGEDCQKHRKAIKDFKKEVKIYLEAS